MVESTKAGHQDTDMFRDINFLEDNDKGASSTRDLSIKLVPDCNIRRTHFSVEHVQTNTHTSTPRRGAADVDPVRVSAKRIIPVFDKLRGSRAFK
jgi:hypothetical protein